jgi:hypothetical protein
MKVFFILSLIFINNLAYSFSENSLPEEKSKSLIQKRQNKAIENQSENVGAASQFEREEGDVQKQQESAEEPSLRFQDDDLRKTLD